MTSMVEKVAEAIYRRGSTHLKPWEEADDGFKDFYRELARAAIEAMKTPTQQMIDAPTMRDWAWKDDDNVSDFEMKQAWEEMIDAALAESKEDEPQSGSS